MFQDRIPKWGGEDTADMFTNDLSIGGRGQGMGVLMDTFATDPIIA